MNIKFMRRIHHYKRKIYATTQGFIYRRRTYKRIKRCSKLDKNIHRNPSRNRQNSKQDWTKIY